MAIAEPKARMTVAQFVELELSDDARFKRDLIDGELVEMPRPTFEHNDLILRLVVVLMPYIEGRRLGRINTDILVLFDPEGDNSYAPDLVFLATEHLDRLREGRIWDAPDLMVETLSPSTAADDSGRKFQAYHRAGVPWYWIVDAETPRVEEHRHTPEGYLRTQTALRGQEFRPGLFPDLALNLAALRPA